MSESQPGHSNDGMQLAITSDPPEVAVPEHTTKQGNDQSLPAINSKRNSSLAPVEESKSPSESVGNRRSLRRATVGKLRLFFTADSQNRPEMQSDPNSVTETTAPNSAHPDENNILQGSQLDVKENNDPFLEAQAMDNEVQTDYEGILGRIRTWSRSFLHDGPISLEHLPRKTLTDFYNIAPSCSSRQQLEILLTNPKNRRLFVRGWVSSSMAISPFYTLADESHTGSLYRNSECQDPWMRKTLGDSVHLIESTLASADRDTVSHRHLNDWRALTIRQLSKLEGAKSKDDNMKTFVRNLVLEIISPIQDWSLQPDPKKIEERLFDIMFDAQALRRTMRVQRACWSIRHLDSLNKRANNVYEKEVLFDHANMKDIDQNEEGKEDVREHRDQRVVEFIVSPGLFKRGNRDGELFDVESCLKRPEVKCRGPPLLQPLNTEVQEQNSAAPNDMPGQYIYRESDGYGEEQGYGGGEGNISKAVGNDDGGLKKREEEHLRDS